MYKIINVIEDKLILLTTNSIEFVNFTKSIFNENEDYMLMQLPTSTLGCVNYINEYCDNLQLFVNGQSK